MAQKSTFEIRNYWKTIIAVIFAILITTVQAAQASYADKAWTVEDTMVTVLAFMGAVLVYAKGNTTEDPVASLDQSVQTAPGVEVADPWPEKRGNVDKGGPGFTDDRVRQPRPR